MEKILCKKSFEYEDTSFGKWAVHFISGMEYFYWTNFGGLNHFVSSGPYHEKNEEIFAFDGEPGGIRPYIYDYFYTKEECRDFIINKIIE